MEIDGYDVDIKIGDQYAHPCYGLGTIIQIDLGLKYPIQMKFKPYTLLDDEIIMWFDIHGNTLYNKKNTKKIVFPMKKIEIFKKKTIKMEDVKKEISKILEEFYENTGVQIIKINTSWCNSGRMAEKIDSVGVFSQN